jgi:hypothetical protein
MIEWFMFGALGFFLGCLLALMLAPPLWNRAVKLTTRRLEATMPMTLADIQADKDQLRAEFAIELRKVEVALDKAKEKAAREFIEANKRRVEIQGLNTQITGVKGQLTESQNENRVLQQTIKRRLPDLETRLKAAKKALADLESVNAELRNTVASQSEALKIARGTVHNQRADIDRLRLSLESGSAAATRGSAKSDGRAVAESQRLAAELSRMQEELKRAKTSAEEISVLRRELNRLASQILTAARTQTVQVEPAAAPQQHAEHEHTEYAGTDGAGDITVREPAYAEAHNGAGAEPMAEETHEATAAVEYEGGEVENAVEAEPEAYADVAPDEYEVVPHEGHEEAYDQESYGDDDEAEEGEPPKRRLAQRFAARRAKRTEKTSGGSLTSRLRGVVAKSPET